MKPHKHAQLAQQYWKEAETDDEVWKNWDYSTDGIQWARCVDDPTFSSHKQYRRRPRTIRIGKYDVPSPLRHAPEVGSMYYFSCFTTKSGVGESLWNGDHIDHRLLNRGMIHITEESAKIHAEALISLTKA